MRGILPRMAKHQKLTPGAEARIFRAGDLGQPIGGGVLVPDDKTYLAVRHLEPGDYVAVDSTGQEVPFTVPVGEESEDVTLVPVKGASLPAPDVEAEALQAELEAEHAAALEAA